VSTANDPGALRQRLLALLGAERELVKKFVELLNEEREVLLQPDMEPLFGIAERKGQLARQLDQLATVRSGILSQARVSADRASIEQFVGKANLSAWQDFLAVVTQARDLNVANGRIITERLKHNHQALSFLMAHADQPATYGPDGVSRMRPGSRILGSV
jgi:flagellar biosynthesis protein FlgN